MPVQPRGVVLPDQGLDPLPEVLRPQREDAGDPLLHDRGDEPEGAEEKDEPEGNINDWVVEHGGVLPVVRGLSDTAVVNES